MQIQSLQKKTGRRSLRDERETQKRKSKSNMEDTATTTRKMRSMCQKRTILG